MSDLDHQEASDLVDGAVFAIRELLEFHRKLLAFVAPKMTATEKLTWIEQINRTTEIFRRLEHMHSDVAH
jgi:hypothetical protein